jgi:hypothetical protein
MSAAAVRVAGAWVDSTNLTGAARIAGAWVPFGPGGATSKSLFTTEVPSSLDSADSPDNYTLGTYMVSSVPGTITHVRWPFPVTAQPGGVAPKANLFLTSTSAKAGGADASFSMPGTLSTPSPPTPAWNLCALNTPVHVTAGEGFCPAVWTPLRYVATPAFLTSDLVNAPLTALTSGGRFASGASGNVDFPTSGFNNGCYFVDVIFIPD